MDKSKVAGICATDEAEERAEAAEAALAAIPVELAHKTRSTTVVFPPPSLPWERRWFFHRPLSLGFRDALGSSGSAGEELEPQED